MEMLFMLFSRLCHSQSTSTKTVTNTLGTEVTTVTRSAVDITVGTVIQIGRVQRFAAIGTMEATLVPDATLADHLFGSEYSETATGTTTGGTSTAEGFALRTVQITNNVLCY